MKNIILISTFLIFLSTSVSASTAPNIQEIRISLDSVWVVIGGILVFFMQAGFALIESGSVRSKNTVNVLMKNYMDTCIGGLVFWLFGRGGIGEFGWGERRTRHTRRKNKERRK